MTLLGVLYGAVLLMLSAVNVLAPQRHGLLALSQILAPLLFVPLLLFVPAAVVRVRPPTPGALRRWLRIVLVACAVVAVVRFVPAWIPSSGPAPAAGAELAVTTWNIESETPEPAAVLAGLHTAGAGIVGVEELGERTAGVIAADPALLLRFPYRVLSPNPLSFGIGLLSSYPFVGTPSVSLDPPLLHTRIDLGGGRTLDVVVAHPLPGQLRTVGPLPVDFDTSVRDTEIATIRSIVDPILASGQPLVLLGDFNTTDREPIYAALSAGLADVQRAVGWGPGPTWRIDPVKWLPFGLLRIDMVRRQHEDFPPVSPPRHSLLRENGAGGRGGCPGASSLPRAVPRPPHPQRRDAPKMGADMFDQYGDFKRQLPDRDAAGDRGLGRFARSTRRRTTAPTAPSSSSTGC